MITGTADRTHVNSFDYLRGFAAFIVVIHHIVGTMTVETAQGHGFWVGAAGVDVFFVLSGFLIFGFIQKASHYLKFWLKRVIRIYPTYLLLTTFFFAVSVTLLGRSVSSVMLRYALSITFIPHLNHLGQLKPLLGDGWSLVDEFWFYTYAALCLYFKRYRFVLFVIPIFVVLVFHQFGAAPISAFLGSLILLEFWLGALAKLLYEVRISKTIAIVVIVVGLSTFFADHFFHFNLAYDRLFVWGLPAFLIVTGASHLKVPYTALGRVLSDTSYPVYLTHPIYVIGAMRLLPHVYERGGPVLLFIGLTIVLASYLTAWLIFKVFSEPVGRCMRDSLLAPLARERVEVNV